MEKAFSLLQELGNNGGEFMKKTGNTHIYLSEFLGTFIFLLCGIGCVGALKLAGASFGQWEISIVWGLAVAMGVYVCGGVCGAHLNPSVTIALALFGDFDKRKVVPYILVQMVAGFYALVDGRNTAPKGNLGGLLIGLLVALIGASFGPLTGFAMNAARDFGPRLFAALAGWGTDVMTGYPLNDNLSMPYFLVPLIAPIIGACIGGWIYKRIIVVALDRNAAAEDKA